MVSVKLTEEKKERKKEMHTAKKEKIYEWERMREEKE